MYWVRLLFSLLLIGIFNSWMVVAQDDITATPAPSKTPTIEPEVPDAEATQEPVAIVEPWTQSDLAILTGNVQRPNGITWFNNNLYTACTGDSTVYELNSVTGLTRTYIFGVHNAHTIHAEEDAAGELHLWVPDFETGRFLHVQRTGINTISADLAGPWGIQYLNDEEFLISNLRKNNVIVMNRAGEQREVIEGLRSPTGLVVDDEFIYVANNGSARRAIEWASREETLTAEGPVSETAPLVTGLQNTTGMVMAADGYLYFAYALGTRGVVGRVDPAVCRDQGGCGNDEVEVVLYTELSAPLAGLAISPDMRLFVHTMFSPDIYWLQLGGAEAD